MLQRTLLALTLILAFLSAPATAPAQEIFTRGNGPALEGYDVVSYFVSGKPVRGSAAISSQYKGAVWRFSSAQNKAVFDADPAKYAPRYGGHCAWGTARGYLVRGDPQVWRIVNGTLYLNYNRSVQNKWNRDISGFISKANRNWPEVLKTKK